MLPCSGASTRQGCVQKVVHIFIIMFSIIIIIMIIIIIIISSSSSSSSMNVIMYISCVISHQSLTTS